MLILSSRIDAGLTMIEKERIKEAARDAGLTHAELAAKMGITPATFSRFVNGKHRPTVRTLKRIAEITGKDLSFFMPGNSVEKNLEVEVMFLRNEIEKLKDEITKLKNEKTN